MLTCSVNRYATLGACERDAVRWVDESGSRLTEGDGHEVLRQTGCVSYLNVTRSSSGRNRKYTCQFVEGNDVKMAAEYATVFSGAR